MHTCVENLRSEIFIRKFQNSQKQFEKRVEGCRKSSFRGPEKGFSPPTLLVLPVAESVLSCSRFTSAARQKFLCRAADFLERPISSEKELLSIPERLVSSFLGKMGRKDVKSKKYDHIFLLLKSRSLFLSPLSRF